MSDLPGDASPVIAAVVLAAGMSRRMGRLKMLLPFGDRPMLARVIESLRATATIGPITVVLGHAEQEIRRVVSEYADVSCVTNAAYAEGGMLSSVKAGVGALPADAAAWFLVLGDQPMVWPPTLEALIGCWEPDRPRIVIPSYRGRRGHPVLIPRALAPEVLALGGDETLKTLMMRHADNIVEVAVDDTATVHDIDTPQDYEAALLRWQQPDASDGVPSY